MDIYRVTCPPKTGPGVKFVACPSPGIVPKDDYLYRHPDDPSDQGGSWREVLCNYNNTPQNNPDSLLPAWKLYRPLAKPAIYRDLVGRFGIKNTFILSAGWGLISANFLTPCYDITFSTDTNVKKYKRRRDEHGYDDLCLLPEGITDRIVFVGAKSYIRLFCRLTESYKGPRTVFYYSADLPKRGCGNLVRFPAKKRRNWQYECAEALISGELVFDTSTCLWKFGNDWL